jgi:hypothetical protein
MKIAKERGAHLFDDAQIVGRGLARPSIGNNIERNPLSLIEDLRPSALDRPDMHEDVLAAFVRPDKSVSLCPRQTTSQFLA